MNIAHLLDSMMNIEHEIAITNEFELWDLPPSSQKAPNNR